MAGLNFLSFIEESAGMLEPRFRVGEFVRRVTNPDIAGVVREARWDSQAETWQFRVLFGNALRGVPDEDLEAIPTVIDPWSSVIEGSYAGAKAFMELMTYERLRKPPSRIAASFGSAKAAFYPYQFKPLLKFVESPNQRLLIVDDVGLGKTIEAGYIIRELRARHELDRVLIVVPARLRNKWKDELERRFSEHFETVGRSELLRAIDRLRRGQEFPKFRWITSYESARDDRFIDALAELQPAIDLVVVDEAHRMRNPETAQHKLGRALGHSADGMVFLTATPVQTGPVNLFWLLHTLDPEQFANADVFAMQSEANRPLVRALTALRQRPADTLSVSNSLEAFAGHALTRGLAKGDFFEAIRMRVAKLSELSRTDIIALERDVSELSLTGHILSRTRKQQVFPNRPQRRAVVLTIQFTPEERHFYDAVAALCRIVRPDLSGWGQAMSMMMAYRYTASCIPAALGYFRQKLGLHSWSVEEALVETEDAPAGTSESGSNVETSTDDISTQIEEIVRKLAPPSGVDSKFAVFRAALDGLWQEDTNSDREPRKVVVFSYFKRTLAYLSTRLKQDGVEHRHIDGDIPIEEREVRIEEFAAKPSVRVLLSSEVGSEGLDLQFASIVFNYDLPWNPMVVEQRIGRVDRIGQASDTITILNLVANDTIESRILLRLYERIGLFKDTIGDIDAILGDPIERLTMEVLRGDLSVEEAERRADEAVDALKRQENDARRLMTEADALMAADQSFLDEVEELVGRRKIPAPEELQVFAETFFARAYSGSRIPRELTSGVGQIEISQQVARDMREAIGDLVDTARVASMIERGAFLATFDQSMALRHPKAELIHGRHPLIQFAFKRLNARHLELHRSFLCGLNVGDCQEVLAYGPALYAFGIWLFDIPGTRPRVELIPIFMHLPTGKFISEGAADDLLLAMLKKASDLDPVPNIAKEPVGKAREKLLEEVDRYRAEWTKSEKALSEARVARQHATLSATLNAKLSAAELRLRNLEAGGAAEFAVRMARLKVARAQADMSTRLAAISGAQSFAIEHEEIAAGLLDVHA